MAQEWTKMQLRFLIKSVALEILKEIRIINSDLNVLLNSKETGGGMGIITIKNAVIIPNANNSNGGILYVENGALKYRGSAGTITPLGTA